MGSFVYLASSLLLLVMAWLTFRVLTRSDYRTKGRPGPVSTLLALLVFALHANLSYLFLPAVWPALPALPQNRLLVALGVSLMVLGLAAVITAMSQLGFGTVFGMKSGALQQRGLYGLSRNPQIVAYGLVLAGFALLWPSWVAVGWVLLYLPVAHMMVLTEEEHLRRAHREAYEEYCRRVPRYLPLRLKGMDLH